ncbi:YrrS family protein [Alkalicoccus daliensis]|uniref:DUF1510 domain-containing protein n=1 Tax=Alkalicoccus daliensis TaxID=745820 RepID=A0A1H0BI74_9BACI|nr:YrrS family protein [Alkalicoccus daliensis]SDN45332.1 Protein of unknown function [Alkalicoccus daliensis]
MSNRIPQRQNYRKKRKINTVLNISIGLVALLILVVSINLFLNSGSNNLADENNSGELASAENNNTENTNNISINTNDNENENNAGEENLNVSINNEENNNEDNMNNENENTNEENNGNNENNENEENNGNNENEENNNRENEENNGSNENESPDGEWEPIGTEQTGGLSGSYERNSQNWQEMVEAITYAVGLPNDEDEIALWRIENGGSPESAVGTLSPHGGDYDSPYQVRIEWVEGEGWQPVDVTRLNSNPYR